MDPLLLIVGLVVGAVFLMRVAGSPAAGGDVTAPPPAPPLPSMPWANAWTGGAPTTLPGPFSVSYVPQAPAGAPPPAPPPPAFSAPTPDSPSGTAYSTTPQMGGASWDAPIAAQPTAGTVLAPPPVATGPATETRSGRGHF